MTFLRLAEHFGNYILRASEHKQKYLFWLFFLQKFGRLSAKPISSLTFFKAKTERNVAAAAASDVICFELKRGGCRDLKRGNSTEEPRLLSLMSLIYCLPTPTLSLSLSHPPSLAISPSLPLSLPLYQISVVC